jgi:hypothetical protein
MQKARNSIALPVLMVMAEVGVFVTLSASSLGTKGAIHVLVGLGASQSAIFPSDTFTVADDTQKTGLRVSLPLPDCTLLASECADIELINALDGFSLQPRVTVPFDGDIDPSTVSNDDLFFLDLGNTDLDATDSRNENAAPRVIGVNQLFWDPATRVLATESDEPLEQHTRYAFVVTTGIRDSAGARIASAGGLDRLRNDLSSTRRHDPAIKRYGERLVEALDALRTLGIEHERVAGLSVFTTQSATAVLEHIRDQLKATTPAPPDFRLGPGGTVARGGLEQAAIFLASEGKVIVHPDPARFFEVPISSRLPEDFSYIP